MREARERRGVSLRQVANATKISLRALEAIERNDIAHLPGGIFSRGFVRSYAIEVGLDPDRTAEEFIAQYLDDSEAAGHRAVPPRDDHESHQSDRRIASVLAGLLAVSVPLAILLVYGAGGGRDDPSEASRLDESSLQETGVRPVTFGPPPPASQPQSASARVGVSGEPLMVVVVATGVCFVEATADGELVVGRELQSGERQIFRVQSELVMRASDASALSLTLNGAPARSLGGPGEAVTLRLTPGDFSGYLEVP